MASWTRFIARRILWNANNLWTRTGCNFSSINFFCGYLLSICFSGFHNCCLVNYMSCWIDMESSQIFPLKKVENGQNSKQAGRRCGHNSARADIRAAPNERRISIGLFSRWNITRKQGQLQDASICFTETTRSQQLKMFNLRMSLFSDLSRKPVEFSIKKALAVN